MWEKAAVALTAQSGDNHEDMAEGMVTALAQPCCLRCATTRLCLTSFSSQGHLAPALLICRI